MLLRYYLLLASQSLRQAPGITALVVVAMALGIGVSMTIFSTWHLMSADPIPEKSKQLFRVYIDSWNPESPFEGDPNKLPYDLTFRDTNAILGSGIPLREVAMNKSGFVVRPESAEIKAMYADALLTGRDFFAMFNVPFIYGGTWSKQDDKQASPVVVISQSLNDKLFAGANSVGKTLSLDNRSYTIVGVRGHWNPSLRFYDLENDFMKESDDIYGPFSLFAAYELKPNGNTRSWKREEINTYSDLLASEVIWPSVWVELVNKQQKQAYQQWLDAYVVEQKKLGRLQRPLNNQLKNVAEYMEYKEVIDNDTRVMLLIGFLFLLVCMVNTTGLLLARFLGKSPVVGIRRALGASRGQVILQHLVEVALVGALGGLLGLAMTLLGLELIKLLWPELQSFARLNPGLILMALGLSVTAALIAGFYPAWRVCRQAPAFYLKLK
ncbi:MAG: ABC transporter permease [Cellvibrionaceae bacterium]|nr:ABC transporter permease [Cellvibrionaceae bacterium]